MPRVLLLPARDRDGDYKKSWHREERQHSKPVVSSRTLSAFHSSDTTIDSDMLDIHVFLLIDLQDKVTPIKHQFISMENNLLEASAADLQSLVASGKLQSVDLMTKYVEQIERHNHDGMKLHAIISTSPLNVALERALALDAERVEHGPRGPLHGIPVIVKMLSR